MKKLYFVWYNCKNCGYEAARSMEFGTPALSNLECTNCGCLKFEPKTSKKPPQQ